MTFLEQGGDPRMGVATVPTLHQGSASTPRELGTVLEGPLGSGLGTVAVFNPCKCLREAASGISWLMPGGGRGGPGSGWS